MFPPDALSAVAALFILAMVWLRTRMQYARGVPARRALTGAGAAYFALLALFMLAGWLAVPPLAHAALGSAPVATPLLRGVWFLGVYYLSIPLHRALRARGQPVFA